MCKQHMGCVSGFHSLFLLQVNLYKWLIHGLLMFTGLGFGTQEDKFYYPMGIQHNCSLCYLWHQLHVQDLAFWHIAISFSISWQQRQLQALWLIFNISTLSLHLGIWEMSTEWCLYWSMMPQKQNLNNYHIMFPQMS